MNQVDEPVADFGIEWHFQRLEQREGNRVARLRKLLNVARLLAKQNRMESLAEQRLISAMYLPDLGEATNAVAEVIADVSTNPTAA